MAKLIDSERLIQMRKLRGLSQGALAKKAQHSVDRQTPLNKQTVYRLEKRGGPAHDATVERLAKALEVDPEVLTGARPIPDDITEQGAPSTEPGYQLNVRVDPTVRCAFELAARRYRVSVSKIAQLAPLLFVIVAEASLEHRRKKLAEFEDALGRVERLESDFLPSFGTDDQDEKIQAERTSIERCDLFGRDRFDPYRMVYHEDESNPFGAYLEALTARNGDVTVGVVASTSTEYRVCRAEAIGFAGGDEQVAEALLNGEVPIHRMPRGLKTIEDRVEWMRLNKISVHKVIEQRTVESPGDLEPVVLLDL